MGLIKCLLLCILALESVSCEKEFRFDYEWNEQARGWLKYHNIPATWDSARLRCDAEGAVLASPLTENLKQAMMSLVKRKEVSKQLLILYTGIHSTFSNGDYSSIEGVPLHQIPVIWHSDEPDNDYGREDCLLMNVSDNGTMADVTCITGMLPFVCYKRDTKLIITECGTTDPEYILDARTGSCYKFHRDGLPWSRAYMTCSAEGGYLAIINNGVEAEVLRDIFRRDTHKKINAEFDGSVFVGFHTWSRYSATFRTIHGESLENNYNVWAPGQPDNSTRLEFGEELGEYCGSVTRDKVQLNDSYCDRRLTFLCEKDPTSLQ